MLHRRLLTNKRTRILATLSRPTYRRAHCAVAVSEGVRQTLQQMYADLDVLVIPNYTHAIDEFPQATDEAKTSRLVTVGSLRALKHHEAAIRTLSLLPDHFTLTIVGDGPLRRALESTARSLGVHERVCFAGWVSDPRPLVSGAVALVHTSSYETFGLAAIEAASCRVPVAAFDVECLDEIVPSLAPGALVPEGDIRALADACLQLASNPITPVEWRVATRRREDRLAPESILEDWKQVLGALPSHRGRRK